MLSTKEKEELKSTDFKDTEPYILIPDNDKGLEMTPQRSAATHDIVSEIIDTEEYEIICAILQGHSYDAPLRSGVNRKPLLITSSGGGGHIAAIKAMLHLFNSHCLTKYEPLVYSEKPPSITSHSIFGASQLNELSYIKGTVDYLNLVVLPSRGKLLKAIEQLQSPESRPYLDVLLDIYEAGDESAALWNINQREDNKRQLALLIALQSGNDNYNYRKTYLHYCNLLEQAYQSGKPYTECISVQAMGLPALCDAVNTYNNRTLSRPKIVIHQYMTDLPTKGAVHFFNVLSHLTMAQQQSMKLYAVGMNQPILNHFFKNGFNFIGVYDINPLDNPMIRHGFFDPTNDNSDKFEVPVTLHYKKNSAFTSTLIPANERVASIMLGSQASTDTVKYVSTLFESGIDKLFIFGGSNIEIKTNIHQLLQINPAWTNKIILLDNQDDPAIASIMSRSTIVIIRSGGLSVMEQMAMKHNKQQLILLHHADPSPNILMPEITSGISWEDGNADILIHALGAKQVTVKKICPEIARDYLQEFNLRPAEKECALIGLHA